MSSLIGSWGVLGPEPERELPQCLLCQVIAEVIKEQNDVIVGLQRVGTARRQGFRCYSRQEIQTNSTNRKSTENTAADSHLLVAPQSVKDVKLLPAFREVDL